MHVLRTKQRGIQPLIYFLMTNRDVNSEKLSIHGLGQAIVKMLAMENVEKPKEGFT